MGFLGCVSLHCFMLAVVSLSALGVEWTWICSGRWLILKPKENTVHSPSHEVRGAWSIASRLVSHRQG